MTHAVERLDDVVHQRVRLGILTVLDELGEADFSYLKTELGLTAGNLSRHLSVLGDADYIAVKKTIVDVRPRTWVRITKPGRAALKAELNILRSLLGTHDEARRRD